MYSLYPTPVNQAITPTEIWEQQVEVCSLKDTEEGESFLSPNVEKKVLKIVDKTKERKILKDSLAILCFAFPNKAEDPTLKGFGYKLPANEKKQET